MYPERFATEILGQNWTYQQIEIAQAVASHTRVAIKSGHSTGKTMGLAGIAIWFLHAYQPSIVVTTAPGEEQVKNEIWREIRNQIKEAKEPLLPGLLPKDPFWDINPNHYAQGLATNDPRRFRGKHGVNMLFILNEANGVPLWVWEEVENMCTAPNNRVVADGNPVERGGPYYDCFKSGSGWHRITLSCLNHPNVLQGRDIIPGAVSWSWADRRVKNLCVPIDAKDAQGNDFEWPRNSGKWWHPGPVFESRVLGEFPTDDPDTLITLADIIRARNNRIEIDETAPIDIGMDVAFKGGDHCCVWARRGPSIIMRRKWKGIDPEKAKRELGAIIRQFNFQNLRVGTVAIDAIGIGAGVAYGIKAAREEGDIKCDRVLAIQVSEKANDVDRYADKRSEIAFALAERFKQGMIDLSRVGDDANDFENQASQMKRDYDSKFRYRLEKKDLIRDRIGVSPDDFDSMALAFIDTTDSFAENFADVMSAA